MPSVFIIQALEQTANMSEIKIRLIVAFETRFGHINFGTLPENP